ncbi:MAG TPA: rRNA maturation RNase YbeY [Candidatus Acidoferrales bacterium]|nr:rRNA maturation RNase YbeY [Candidatus Acidoferrales bacterium]
MILNQQRQVKVSISGLEEFSSKVRRVLRIPATALTICLVTNANIAKWNRLYRGKNRPTDVLSFATDEPRSKQRIRKSPGKGASFARGPSLRYLGDIAIAPNVARQNARRFGRDFDAEMRILILHGILHLMGYDHETDQGQMDRREMRLRRHFGLA